MYKGLSVFDLDHTLLTVNSSYRFGAYLYRIQYFSKIDLLYCLGCYASHKVLGMSMKRLHTNICRRLFYGKPQIEIDRHVRCFLDQELNTMIHPRVYQRLLEAKKAGHYVTILSSSPDFLVQPIAECLGVDYWQSTIYGKDSQGNFNHILSVLNGAEKAENVLKLAQQLHILPASIIAYSDSELDVPLLAMAGQAVGVRPTFKLRRICLKNGWEIMQ